MRGLGELANLTTTKWGLWRLSAVPTPARPLPRERVAMIWRGRPGGAWPELLALYRSADPGRLAAAGACLGDLRCPALMVWGRRDPFIPSRFGRAYAERLGDAELVELDRAGHWPWLDRPELVCRVLDFLDG